MEGIHGVDVKLVTLPGVFILYRLLTPPGTPLVIAGPENEPVIDSGYDSSQKGFPNLVKSLATMKTNQVSRYVNA